MVSGFSKLDLLYLEASINIFVTIMLIGYLTYIWLNSKKDQLVISYAVTHLMTVLLILGHFSIRIAPNTDMLWICIIIGNILKICFDISFLYQRYFFLKGRYFKLKTTCIIFLYPFISFIVILSNPWHRLFVTHFTGEGFQYGVLFYVITSIGYCLQLIGITFILKADFGKNTGFLFNMVLMSLTAICFTAMYLYQIGLLPSPVDIIPIVVFIIFTSLFWGAYRFGFITTVSYGISRSLEMFSEAFMVTDKKGRILSKNNACESYDCKLLNTIIQKVFSAMKDKGYVENTRFELELPDSGKHLVVTVYPVQSTLLVNAHNIFIIHDDFDIITTIQSIKEKNKYLEDMNESLVIMTEETKKLAVQRERNYLAKEIHDVLGHSLVLVLNIMESNKIILETQPELALDRLKQAMQEMNHSMDEISSEACTTAALSDKDSYASFCQRLELMVVKLQKAGIKVELSIMDDISGCSIQILNTLFRICQEASTNSIKHGHATQIIISIIKRAGAVVLRVVDNGLGSQKIIKGNGLQGMELRVKMVDGKINFSSFEDSKGFLVHASVPIK